MPSWPDHDDRTLEAMAAALRSQRWAVATPAGAWPRRIGLAEQALADLFGRRHAVTTCNGSAAIVLSLQALGIGPGDRVLCPATTWIGCLTAILRLGAHPVLADAEPDRPVADLAAPGHADIRAVIAIPLYASRVDLAPIRAAYPAAPIVLDLSHVLAAPGQDLGFADAAVAIASLQASKVLTCGEGGVAVTDDADLARRIEALRTDSRVLDGPAEAGASALIPGRVGHGANHALSELSAGVLLDQIAKLGRHRALRATGGRHLLARLAAHGLDARADPACIDSGLHYGIPVRVQGPPDTVIDRVQAQTGLALKRCYPPLPDDPLCAVGLEARYRGLTPRQGPFPNARSWHDRAVVIPQQVLLEPEATLDRLAASIAGAGVPARPPEATPAVTVVMVTDGKRASLADALADVAGQTYPGPVQVLLVLDRCHPQDLTLPADPPPHTTVRIDLDADGPIIRRVASLRDMALRLCQTPLVCFLDDDNRWAPDHLAGLWRAMAGAGTPAAHSWRRLVPADGQPWRGDHFPWLAAGSPEERAHHAACVAARIITPGSDVVKDTAQGAPPPLNTGMVDLGTWLFETALLRVFGLDWRPADPATPTDGLGEDDILLARLTAAAVPVACSETPSLLYALGGFSNDSSQRHRAWVAADPVSRT